MAAIRSFPAVLALALLAGCVTEPPIHTEVVTMKAGEGAAASGLPPPGTVWRLDERDLRALSPAPIVEGPPPPNYPPPPRPEERYQYGPYPGPYFNYWGRW